MFYEIEIDKILCSLKSSAFSFLEASLSKEQTNSKKYNFYWFLSVCSQCYWTYEGLDERYRMRTNDEDKRYCTPYSLLMWASECWVNVVIVCNLKRPSDHQHSSRDRESGEPSLTEGEPHSETEETSYFPKYLHIPSRNLSVIMFWKH